MTVTKGKLFTDRRTQPKADGPHACEGVAPRQRAQPGECRSRLPDGTLDVQVDSRASSRPAVGTCRRGQHFGLAIVACVAYFLAGCGADTPGRPTVPLPAEASKSARELRIAAAADLKFVLVDLVAAFEKSCPGTTIAVTTGSSGNLFAQLTNEVPFDLFLSADTDYPEKLLQQGQALEGSDFQYAIGHLVLWVARDMPFDVEREGMNLLRDEIIRKVAIANPKTAPYGRAAVAALQSLQVYDAVESRLVFGENIAQTAQMAESGAADAGIISLSLAVSPALRDKGRYWKVPSDAHPPIVQGGVVLRWAQDAPLAREFRDFLLSAEGRRILGQYGFDPAGE